MSTLAPSFIAGSAAIIMLLGLIHLLYTFYGPKLLPRDREAEAVARCIAAHYSLPLR